MRIGDLAARTGASIRSLRYYEEQGLLHSRRSAGGQRHYTEQDVGRVRYLQRLYAAGLSSQTILTLLPCVDSPSDAATDAAFERLVQERDRLTAHLAELTDTRDSLDALIAANRRYRTTGTPDAPHLASTAEGDRRADGRAPESSSSPWVRRPIPERAALASDRPPPYQQERPVLRRLGVRNRHQYDATIRWPGGADTEVTFEVDHPDGASVFALHLPADLKARYARDNTQLRPVLDAVMAFHRAATGHTSSTSMLRSAAIDQPDAANHQAGIHGQPGI